MRRNLTIFLGHIFRIAAGITPTSVARIIGGIGWRIVLAIKPENDALITSKRVRLNGSRFTMALDITKKTQIFQFIKPIYQPELTKPFLTLLRPGDGAFLDIGAHIGYFSLIAASKLSESDPIYAFEPDTYNRAGLQYQIAINNFKRIAVAPYALSDKEGVGVLHRNPLNEGGHSLKAPEKVMEAADRDRLHRGYKFEESVQVTSLDAFLSGIPSFPIQLMKIDVEQHERACLKGMEKLLGSANKPKRIICEVSPGTIRDVQKYLESFGYKTSDLSARGIIPVDENTHLMKGTDLLFEA